MSAARSIPQSLAELVAPLAVALESPAALGLLLDDLGWVVTLDDDHVQTVANVLSIAEPLEVLIGGNADVVAATAAAADLFDAIAALAHIEADALASLPAPLDDPVTWPQIGLDLPEHLLVTWLQLHLGVIAGLAAFAGVLRVIPRADGRQPRTEVDWDAAGSLIADPAGHIAAEYGWGGDLDHARLVEAIAAMASGLGIQVRTRPVRDSLVASLYDGTAPTGGLELELPIHSGWSADGASFTELGLLVVPAPGPTGAIEGVLLTGEVLGAAGTAVDLGDGRVLRLAGGADATGGLSLIVLPGGASSELMAPAISASAALDVAPDAPMQLLGEAGRTGLGLEAFTLDVTIAGTPTAPELVLGLRTQGLKLTVAGGDGDSFLADVLGDAPVIVGLDLDATWSSRQGLSFAGSTSFDIDLALSEQIGPLMLESVRIALAGTDGITIEATVTGGLTIGPFSAFVENIGLRATAAPASSGATGVLGPLDVSFAFCPPTTIGLGLDIDGVVSGGGIIGLEPDIGRYWGAVALEFPAVGLGAVVVVDTQLPGDPDGWALFASVFATFPSIPLGFGFFLSGVGGIVCLNRTMDAEAIASGLKSGAVDAILFPDDPVNDAQLIISQLDSWFPFAEGSAVFGIAATITWGTPTAIVTGQLGVMVSFPDLDIAILGSVFLALPTEEEALIELHMDTIGVIDVSEGTVLVAASLYDSSLLQTINLSGDMAMYARVSGAPYFLLSVGGYHPNFQPPGGLPASVTDLRRMRAEVAISDDIWYALEAYVAITSNTVQFGSLAELEASAKFLLSTYTARGSVGFDVLLVFSPFKFTADFHASVSVTAGDGDKELLAVSLAAHLEGPKPWFATGVASFDFFGISVSFEVAFGGSAPEIAPPRINVLDLVLAAFDDAGAWRAEVGTGASPVIVTEEESDELWVRPDGELVATQTLAPLDRPMQVYGTYAIDGPTRLGITDAGIDGVDAVDWGAAPDWFAPALYDEMTRAEKLEAPSYEEMTAGVSLTSGAASFRASDATVVTPDYEVRIIDKEETRPLARPQPLAVPLATATAGLALGASRGPRTATSQRFVVGPTTWQTVDATTGTPLDDAGTYRHVLATRSRSLASDPTVRATQRSAPSHAIR